MQPEAHFFALLASQSWVTPAMRELVARGLERRKNGGGWSVRHCGLPAHPASESRWIRRRWAG